MAKTKPASPGDELPVLTLLSDHPIFHPGADDGISHDMLDLHERLLAPLDILRHPATRTPFTIALYGDWGTGKTSAMRWLENQICIWNESKNRDKKSHPHLTTVWFYPWKYHTREDVWRGIIAEVILGSLKIGTDSGLPNRLAKAGKQFGKFLGHSFLHALSNIKFDAKVLGTGAEISGQVFQDIHDEYNQTARPHTPFLNDFENQLSEWVHSTFNDETHRLIIFIDDLDRCLPAVALEVLEALKLYLNIPGLLFVAGLDRGVIDQIVTDHYKKSGVEGAIALRYLDKIFQVDIDVAPSETKVSAFLDQKIAQLNQATGSLWTAHLERKTGEDGYAYKKIIEDAVRRLGRHNPREFTRILNSMLITAHAASTIVQPEMDVVIDRANRCLRFSQGAQVYLLRRLLHDYTAHGEILLRTKEGQQWLQQFSEIRIQHPDARPPGEEDRDHGGKRPDEKPKPKPGSPEPPGAVLFAPGTAPPKKSEEVKPDTNPYSALLARSPRIDHALEAFKSIVTYGWDLMLIPFDTGVAAAMPKESVKPSAASPTPSPLAAIPEEILSAIARSLEIPIQELGPQQLLAVERLDLTGTQILDVSPLQSLANLRELYLKGTPVSDVTPLQCLANLRELFLTNTMISDVSSLGSFVNLRELGINFTRVHDVTPLQSLANLKGLYLRGTSVSDVTPLHNLADLQELYLGGTPAAKDEAAMAALRKALPNCNIAI